MRVGIMHPGAMGSALAAQAGTPCLWASTGRSPATRSRADAAQLTDVGTIERLARASDVLVSVCPPHAAADVADRVAALGFDGIYVDVNAIAPELAQKIGGMFDRFVDGGIVGPPPEKATTTRLYLSGDLADDVAAVWAGGKVDVRIVGNEVGAASGLKMAYAGWTKGSAALLLALRSYAESLGVDAPLADEWELSQPGLNERLAQMAGGVGPKAWRFAGEMRQIAAALASSGLPDGFHIAAGEIYQRLAGFKDAAAPALDDVVERILAGVGGDDATESRSDRTNIRG